MPAILQAAPPSPRGSSSIPAWFRSSLVTCTDGRSTASAVSSRPRQFHRLPRGRASSGGKVEGSPWRHQSRVDAGQPANSRFGTAAANPAAGSRLAAAARSRPGCAGGGRPPGQLPRPLKRHTRQHASSSRGSGCSPNRWRRRRRLAMHCVMPITPGGGERYLTLHRRVRHDWPLAAVRQAPQGHVRRCASKLGLANSADVYPEPNM
jgi:hypothetical protein